MGPQPIGSRCGGSQVGLTKAISGLRVLIQLWVGPFSPKLTVLDAQSQQLIILKQSEFLRRLCDRICTEHPWKQPAEIHLVQLW